MYYFYHEVVSSTENELQLYTPYECISQTERGQMQYVVCTSINRKLKKEAKLKAKV